MSETAVSARSTLRRRGYAMFVLLPRPLQQTCRLIGRTGRGTLDDRVPGLAAEAAFFTLISLPALLLAVVGSLGFVAAALGGRPRRLPPTRTRNPQVVPVGSQLCHL